MNTSLKQVEYITCMVCGDTYARVGETAIRLASRRPPNSERKGICPKHKLPVGDSK